MKIKEAQKFVKEFTESNGWKDEPNIDKIDHLHEELVEISRHLRYKELEERKRTLVEKQGAFEDGIGDLLFGTLRLANQLGVDAEKAFEKSSKDVIDKYKGRKEEKVF